MKREHIIQSTLPSGYCQLEYIESTGTQWIDTLDYIQSNDIVEMEVIPTLDTGNRALYGCTNGNAWNTGGYELYYYNDWLQLITPSSNSYSQLTNWYSIWVTGNTLNIRVERTSWTINGITASKYNTYLNYVPSRTLFIFGSNRNNGVVAATAPILMKLMFFRWYRNNALLHNFIPALRISDTTSGLYDIVNNQFYTNAGTGEFLYN